MQAYEVKTPLRGFGRADGSPAPIGVGEVVLLSPYGVVPALLEMGAIEPTDAAETCPISCEVAAHRRGVAQARTIVVDDRDALIVAIGDLGGLVFFPGEGLPDGAEDVLGDFSNDQLRAEMDARVQEGRLPPVVPTIIGVDPGATGGDKSAAVIVDGSGAVIAVRELSAAGVHQAEPAKVASEPTPATPAPPKSARKKA